MLARALKPAKSELMNQAPSTVSSSSSGPSLSDWMHDLAGRTNAFLAAYFEEKQEETRAISVDSLELTAGAESLTMRGGKRFRPMMCEAGYLAVEASPTKDKALPAGAALEVLQSYLLIHDDWMDQDESRRGKPAVHVMYRDSYDEHLANSCGILAGDLASAYSQELLLRTEVSPEKLRELFVRFTQVQKEVILGQHLDITASPQVARMHDLKTTSYTVRGPLLIGGAIGNMNAEQEDVLTRYADPLGQAFQIADDLLGTFGDMDKTGKPGNDLRNGKRTALVKEAEATVAENEREVLDVVIRGEKTDDDAVRAAADFLVSSGVRARVKARLMERGEEAKSVVRDAPLTELGKTLLTGLADRLAHRAD